MNSIFLSSGGNLGFEATVAPHFPDSLVGAYDTISGSLGPSHLRSQCTAREFKQHVLSHGLAEGALTVIFVRHGRSVANEREAIQKVPALADGLKNIPNHSFPLVKRGINQAHAAGRYLAHMVESGLIPPIDRVICSPFQRTEETLLHLTEGIGEYCSERSHDLGYVFEDGAATRTEPWLRVMERFWADFERLPQDQQTLEYKKRLAHPLDWVPHGARSGETMSEVGQRASDFFSAMHRPEFRGKVVLVVTHGEFMNAAELVIRRLGPFSESFRASFEKGIPNCGIMMVSRASFGPEMQVPLEPLGGFSQELRVVPYELSQAARDKYSEWQEPVWRPLQKERKGTIGEFAPTEVSEEVAQFSQQVAAKGIGMGRVRSLV